MSTTGTHIRSVTALSDNHRIEATVEVEGRLVPVYFETADAVLHASHGALLPAAQLLAMRTRAPLHIHGSVSPGMLSRMPLAQNIYAAWNGHYHPVPIRDATPLAPPPSREGRTGALFTAGLDSFHTFLTHREEIDDLIFVHGFDVPLGQKALRNRIAEEIHRIAAGFRVNLVMVETNLKESLLDGYTDWWRIAHGAGLATVCHLLAPRFKRIYIPASCVADKVYPCGSHPRLDPLWSTESLEFIHDGLEASRVRKAALVAGEEMALQTLRVCNVRGRDEYNCGRCEKCVRTMLALRAVGALERCTAFATPLTPDLVRSIDAHHFSIFPFLLENLEALRARPGNQEFIAALTDVLRRTPRDNALKDWALRHYSDYPRFFRIARGIVESIRGRAA